jgi:LmbE family N-acetylglucosaminyl deacetylase
VLAAIPVHLEFLDGQYRAADVTELAIALREQIEDRRPPFVLGPLGVRHQDHRRVREAVLSVDLNVPIYLYADLPYCVDAPADAQASFDEIIALGYQLEPTVIGSGDKALKTAALDSYPSQVQQYDVRKMLVPERFWRVTRHS